ncbi:MAG: DUF2281 domain-containing protein [Candidatus Lindowbacteria bacterium]|nr:DUF2281 domain-containing protein [Candidatus Lindowbacteria bacterium]
MLTELEEVPEPFLTEILDFVHFIKGKMARELDAAVMSESSLGKDWLRPEEDEAWKGL